ncbi:MAG: GAF domain-containing protein, partial [Clostridiales bacterium]|nr:GAF domain-containing protein [Clostridiales bacterium]
MTHQFEEMYPIDKAEMYALLKKQLAALMEGETRPLPHLCNAAALIFGALEDINWAGFYLLEKDGLLLGPFQGKPACIHIPMGKGVCGTAALEDKTIIVDNVHHFPGHITCDSASNSEIVIPIRVGGIVIGVLDIDSPSFSRFDRQDQQGL